MPKQQLQMNTSPLFQRMTISSKISNVILLLTWIVSFADIDLKIEESTSLIYEDD